MARRFRRSETHCRPWYVRCKRNRDHGRAGKSRGACHRTHDRTFRAANGGKLHHRGSGRAQHAVCDGALERARRAGVCIAIAIGVHPIRARRPPGVFVLGIFTVVRLVDTTLENQQYLTGISRIRGYYRTLTPEAAQYLRQDTARWPEASVVPSLTLGQFFAMFGTTAVMIAFLNNLVAGAAITLGLTAMLWPRALGLAIGIGVPGAVTVMAAFMSYQRRRFEGLQRALGHSRRRRGEACGRARRANSASKLS